MYRSLYFSVVLAVLGLATPQAEAAIQLTMDSDSFLGIIIDGIPPSGEVGYINNLITLAAGAGPTAIGTETYDRRLSELAGPFPTVVSEGAFKDENQVFAVTLLGTYQYILGKYDQDQAGSLVWYSASGFTGQVELPAEFNGKDISHISAYNNTSLPEPISIALWGIGIGCLGAVSLRRRK